ncbi:MAG: hypothetical protein CVT90_03115, partial [Candidatus Altiarchaeales archaeon HGW-Altiarchaeales-3]
MVIVIITHYWKNSPGGGIKMYTRNLVDELKKRDNIKVKVIFKEGKDLENAKVGGSKFLFPIKTFFVLRKFKPRVIHSQGTWYCLLPGYIYKKIFGGKLIHTFHTVPDKKLPFLGKIFIQTLLEYCDCVTFVSKGLKNKSKYVYALHESMS